MTLGKRKATSSNFVHCPICSRSFPQHAIEAHAWRCVPPTSNPPTATSLTVPPDQAAGARCSNSVPLDNALERLMEGGKRAVEVERARKNVPAEWPVESIKDILPLEKAEDLLACLLEISRGWTTQPWFTSNGVEGRSHSRSRAFYIPTAEDRARGFGTVPKNVPVDGKARDAGRYAASRPTVASQRRGSTDTSSAGAEPSRNVDGGFQFSDSEEFDYESCPPGEGHIDPSVDRPSSVQQLLAGRSDDRTNKLDAQHVVVKPPNSTGRPSTSEHLKPSERLDAAPPELLEIVPVVVEAVRRRQRRRMEEGLDGSEGLNWNPNFCICHVYDDHRSHLGPHSDTLDNIGPQAIITGVSLGAKRVFVVQKTPPWGAKAKSPSASGGYPAQKKFLDMPHNSAIVMWAGCQERFKHSVPSMPKGVDIHPVAGTKRISITLRERKETLPSYLMPIPECRCRVPAVLRARVLDSGQVQYYYECDRGQGQCGFLLLKNGPKT
ncbi:unnamed protein product [Scytosiphon promiscuus]